MRAKKDGADRPDDSSCPARLYPLRAGQGPVVPAAAPPRRNCGDILRPGADPVRTRQTSQHRDRIAQRQHHVLSYLDQGLGETIGGHRLALAQGSWSDGGHVAELVVRHVLLPFQQGILVDLGLILAVYVDLVIFQSHLPGDLDDWE
mgnify:CR=1 FL=1